MNLHLIPRVESPIGMDNVGNTTDFLIGWLLRAPWGVLEADYGGESFVEWHFKTRKSGEVQVVLETPRALFRPILAPLGFRLLNNPYRGQGSFSARFEDEPAATPAHFSLFLCNEAETAVWIKIYRMPTFDEQFRPAAPP